MTIVIRLKNIYEIMVLKLAIIIKEAHDNGFKNDAIR